MAVVLDLRTRWIVGWAPSEKPDAELVNTALDIAYAQRGGSSDLPFHSDKARNMEAGVFANAFGDIACVRA